MSKIIILSLACLFATQLWAQDNLSIGFACPDVPLSVVNSPTPITKLFDFKGRAVILDFWATWCGACVFSFPKMDSLQREFGDQLAIVPVTSEDSSLIKPFLDKVTRFKGIHLYSVVNDILLASLFPHNMIPHYIWLDKDGVVRGITYSEDVTRQNIEKLINGGKLNLNVKNDRIAETELKAMPPMDDSTVMEFHQLSNYRPGANSTIRFTSHQIKLTNTALMVLFDVAYGEGLKFMGGFKSVKLLTSDSAAFVDRQGPGNWSADYRTKWIASHGLTYELKVPTLDSSRKWEIMRRDLSDCFPYISVQIEQKQGPSLVLCKADNNNSFQSGASGAYKIERNPYSLVCKNVPMKSFLLCLNLAYQGSPLKIIDETGYSGNVTIDLETEIGNPQKLDAELKKYGLTLKEEERPVEILVIRDLRDRGNALK